jgi:hypothetical protein
MDSVTSLVRRRYSENQDNVKRKEMSTKSFERATVRVKKASVPLGNLYNAQGRFNFNYVTGNFVAVMYLSNIQFCCL